MSNDNENISALVKANIEARIVEAFRETPQMIDELVKSCLSQEVDERGGKPDYYTKSRMPYLTWLARSAVQDVAAAAVREYITEVDESIRAQVRRALTEEDIVDAFTKNILSATRGDWKIKVEFIQNHE